MDPKRKTPAEGEVVIKKQKQTYTGESSGTGGQSEKSETEVPNWKTFEYDSKPPNRPEGYVYYHRLTEQYSTLFEDTINSYKDFDTLIHVTSFNTAKKILDGELKQQVVEDSSVVRFKPGHPLSATKVLWYGPGQREELKQSETRFERYGNVVFLMKTLFGLEGIYREANDFNYYFVEIIDYDRQSACRILITKKEYPDLLKYDPYTNGGPWYIENGVHKHLTKIKHKNGNIVKNSLEFMREEEDNFKPIWLANHDVSHVSCYSPRKGVEIVNDDDGKMKLALGLLAYKMKNKGQSFIQQLCFLIGDVGSLLKKKMESKIKIENKKQNMNLREADKELEHTSIGDKTGDQEFDLKAFITDHLTNELDHVDLFDRSFDDACHHLITKTNALFRQGLPDALVEIVHENLFYEKTNPIAALQNYTETRHENGGEMSYKHWLSDWIKIGEDKHYTEFDTIIHMTSFETAFKIFEEGKLNQKAGTCTMSSMIKTDVRSANQYGSEEKEQNSQPLPTARMLSYFPNTRQCIKDGIFPTQNEGKVMFVMKNLKGHEGIVERNGDENFHYYFLEVVENCTSSSSICRILVTKNKHPQLTSYDPKKKGGPWLFENGRHKYLKNIRNIEGKEMSNTVEFYREEQDHVTLLTKWARNHEICCRTNVNKEALQLALGLLACKFANPENMVLDHWFMLDGNFNIFEHLEETHKKTEQKLLSYDHTSNTSYPDYLSGQIAHLMDKSNFGQNGEEIIDLYTELKNQVNFKDMNMNDLTESILKFYRKLCFDSQTEFQDIYQRFLSLINPDHWSVFHMNLARVLKCLVLHRIHKRVNVKHDWKQFVYHIKHPQKGMITHWLPDDYRTLGQDDDYEEFDVLIKSKDELSYYKNPDDTFLCRSTKPILHRFECASVVNIENTLYDSKMNVIGTHNVHPLARATIYRYTADKMERIKDDNYRLENYGEDTLRMESLFGNEGVSRSKDDFCYYLIEIIDHPEVSVCRILATYEKRYPGLLQIDIGEDIGRISWIRKLFCLKRIRNNLGNLVKCRTEIVREIKRDRMFEYDNWYRNHTTIMKKC